MIFQFLKVYQNNIAVISKINSTLSLWNFNWISIAPTAATWKQTQPCNSGFSLPFFPLTDRSSCFLWFLYNPNEPAKFFVWQIFIVDAELLAVKDNQLFIPTALEIFDCFQIFFQFIGSRDEKLVVLYCKQLGINNKNLSDEEFRWLIQILKKSKKMGTPISQRKKR